jgi:DNA-binding PadR family transcriptional regulator
MRRKEGRLVPLEVSILGAGIELHGAGLPSFHGFLIAKHLRDREKARLLTAHGTLYRALNRLEEMGLLSSDWEDSEVVRTASRPPRRLYEVTAAGRAALADEQQAAAIVPNLRVIEAPS